MFAIGSSNLKYLYSHDTKLDIKPDTMTTLLGQAVRVQGAMIDAAVAKLCEQEARRAAEGDLAVEAQIRTMHSNTKSGQPIRSTMFVSSRL